MNKKKVKKKKTTRKKKRQQKLNFLFPHSTTSQKIQKSIVKWLRSFNYDVEGRMQNYLCSSLKKKSEKFGYTSGLPPIEIHTRRGKYIKCGIYIDKMTKDDKEISDILKKEGYLILSFNGKLTEDQMKNSINQNYLKLKRPDDFKLEDHHITKTTYIGKKRKRMQKEQEKNGRPNKKRKLSSKKTIENYKKESQFHIDTVDMIRYNKKKGKFPKNLILEGRVQGNIYKKKVIGFSNSVGYQADSSDLTIKNKSKFGFNHLEIELKKDNKKPRDTQSQMLQRWVDKYNHFSTYVNTSEGKERALKDVYEIIDHYFNGPLDHLLLHKYY
jgi:hypothetical protein